FAQVHGTTEEDAWALFDGGKALRVAGRVEQSIALLEEAMRRLPTSPWPLVELAMALATQEQFARARRLLQQADALDRGNPTIGCVLRRPVAKHLERAAHYAAQGDYVLAVRDFESALILEPGHARARADRLSVLAALERERRPGRALADVDGDLDNSHVV